MRVDTEWGDAALAAQQFKCAARLSWRTRTLGQGNAGCARASTHRSRSGRNAGNVRQYHAFRAL